MLSVTEPPVARVPRPVPVTPRAELNKALRLRTPRAKGTLMLVAANAALFVAVAAASGSMMRFRTADLVAWGADFGPRTSHGEWWRLLTATFLHVGLLHVVLNVAALFAVGPLVERLIGTRGYIVLYLACGAVASAVSHWM